MASTISSFIKLIHPWSLAELFTTKTPRVRYLKGELTFKVLAFDVALTDYVHGDLVQLRHEALYFAAQIFNRLLGRLLVEVLLWLNHQEVDLLGLPVELLPAEGDRPVASILEGGHQISLPSDFLEHDLVLRRRKLNLVLSDARASVRNGQALSPRARRHVQAPGLSRVEHKLQSQYLLHQDSKRAEYVFSHIKL